MHRPDITRPLASPAAVPDDHPTAAKRLAMQAARESRLAHQAADRGEHVGPPNVLVHNTDRGELESLCTLLEGFGFCTYPAHELAQARWLSQTQEFKAACVTLRFDSEDLGLSLDLCHRVKAEGLRSGTDCALIVLYEAAHAMDRVRAMLVGADAILTLPTARGCLAAALEECRVRLPADARRLR